MASWWLVDVTIYVVIFTQVLLSPLVSYSYLNLVIMSAQVLILYAPCTRLCNLKQDLCLFEDD